MTKKSEPDIEAHNLNVDAPRTLDALLDGDVEPLSLVGKRPAPGLKQAVAADSTQNVELFAERALSKQAKSD